MREGLELLFRSDFGAAARLGVDEPLSCRRAWPFGDHGWAALFGSEDLTPTGTWALLKLGRSWPSAVHRLFKRGKSRWLLDRGVAAWPLETEPVAAKLGNWLDPASVGLPGSLQLGRVVGYKPLRRVVTSFADGYGRPLYFTKHLRPAQAQRSAHGHRLIASWWRGSAEFRLPPLVSADRELGHLVWQAVPGVALRHTAAGHELSTATHAAGRLLASLHGCPATLPGSRTREFEMRTIESWLAVMRCLVEQPSGLERGLVALGESERWLPPARTVVSHGDFHDGQILVDEEKTTLLDLDTLAMAEPELDIGNFLAHLDLLALDRPDVSAADLEKIVLEAYAQGRGPLLSVPRITWYRAAAALRLACVHAPRPESRRLLPQLARRAMQLVRGLWMEREEVVS